MKLRSIFAALVALSAMSQYVSGDVILPAIFGDHMVLQRNAEVTIWGYAKPYETVSVSPGWTEEKPFVLVGRDGRWAIKLRTPDAGGPYSVTVQGYNTVTIDDVLIGEVWLCSGQSNMEFSSDWVHNFAKEVKEGQRPATFDPDKEVKNIDAQIAAADYPQMRFFTVGCVTADAPQNDLYGHWVVCTPDTMKGFSLAGYYFGRKLHTELDVPVGMINSSWGGTPADVWTPADLMASDSVLNDFTATRDKETWGPYKPGVLFNAMIYPLIPFRIAGVIWNQGEENVGLNRGDEVYARMFATMVKGWREHWGYDFPFFYVQIPPYRYDAENPAAFRSAQLRDQQRKALAMIPDSAMIVISDVGNVEDIHPMDKLSVGERLATWALNRVYNVSDEIPCGPLYSGMSLEGNALRVSFEYAADGLQSIDGKPLTDFQIAGADRVFHPATAVIDGETVLVSSPDVQVPVAVRFAWTNIALPNLASSATGLPASTFRSDNWPLE
ncbi:MAG: sialate O-acetylesterase [Opitutales bacterium]|jgi:sialate O-acetylesterase